MKSILDLFATGVVRVLASTWRFEVVGEAHVSRLRNEGVPVIFTVWHAFLLIPLWHRRDEGITLLVSDHGDAGYLARAAVRLGYAVVRGSSTRGAIKGTKGLMRTLSSGGDVALTPDGPTGPPRIVKPGAVAMAVRTGAAIVPIGAGASSWWLVRSWDRFSIPRPFARVRVVYGEPLRAGRQLNGMEADVLPLLGERLEAAREIASC